MNTQVKKIIVGIVILVFLVVCYFISSKVNSTSQQEDTNLTQEDDLLQTDLVGRISDDIENAVIERANDKIELIKLGEGENLTWTLKGYENVDFNQDNIGIIAMSLSTLYSSEKICDLSQQPDSSELEIYGLANPQTTATVNFSDGSTTVIYIGNFTADKLYNYAMVKGGDGVYLIDEINNRRFNYTLNDLVNKDIPIIKAAQILYIDINQRDKDEIEIEYKEDSEGNAANLASYGMQALTMKKPVVGAAVYPNNIQSTILKNVSSISLGAVVMVEPEDLSVYGLDNPYLEIKLRDIDNELKIKIGNSADEDNYYCMVQDYNTVFLISKSHIELFENANIIDFIERFVSLVYKKDVNKVNLSGFDKNYQITMKENPEAEKTSEDDDTRIGVLNDVELDADSFSNLYQTIIGITFDSLSNTEQISGEPEVVINFELIDGSIKEVKYYEYKANNNFYIAEIDSDTSRLVNKQSVKSVFNVAEKLLDK